MVEQKLPKPSLSRFSAVFSQNVQRTIAKHKASIS